MNSHYPENSVIPAPLFRHINGIIQIGTSDGGEIPDFLWVTNNILLFEPLEEMRNVVTNKLTDDVRFNESIFLYPYIFSDKCESRDWYITEGGTRGTSSLLKPNYAVDLPPVIFDIHKIEKRDTITLDNFFITHTNHNIQNYNTLFMDAQGAEPWILKGASDTLKHIDLICLEIFYHTERYYEDMWLAPEIHKLMEELGYEICFDIPTGHFLTNNCWYNKKGLII